MYTYIFICPYVIHVKLYRHILWKFISLLFLIEYFFCVFIYVYILDIIYIIIIINVKKLKNYRRWLWGSIPLITTRLTTTDTIAIDRCIKNANGGDNNNK